MKPSTPTQPNSTSTEQPSWQDLLGERRRRASRERRERLCDIGKPGPAWINETVDADALDVAYWSISYIAPDSPPGRDREALAVLIAFTALFDSAATKMKDFNKFLDRDFRGQTVRQWIIRAGQGVDGETADALMTGVNTQIDQLAANRIERTLTQTSEQHRLNQTDYRDYVRWRNREGAFQWSLRVMAVAAGIDMRTVPRRWIDQTVEASIVNFDVHGALRHACEDEIGHVLNYLPGDQHSQISACLELVAEIMLGIQDAPDLEPAARAFLMRFISCTITMNYSCRRYASTTPLHIAQPRDVKIYWAQVNDSPNYRYTLTEVQPPSDENIDIQSTGVK